VHRRKKTYARALAALSQFNMVCNSERYPNAGILGK
jgi:hypothetical protein